MPVSFFVVGGPTLLLCLTLATTAMAAPPGDMLRREVHGELPIVAA